MHGGETARDKPLGVALLGLGKYATERLAPGLRQTKHCQLRGIITGTPSKIPTWQERYTIPDENVYTYDDLHRIVDNPDIDVVYVVTPNHTHATFAIAAAQAKKHVWLEKPMALNARQCQAIIAACAENGVRLTLGYRMQHEPNTQTIMNYAMSLPYGPILELDIQAGFRGFESEPERPWRLQHAAGGGALYDMGVYCINAARYATGEEPTLVTHARQWCARADLFSEVDEWTEFDLHFMSGAVAHCKTSFGQDMNRLRVVCELGSYVLEPMQQDQVRGETSDGRQLNRSLPHLQAKQMDDEAIAQKKGSPPFVPGEEGLRDVRIIEAVQAAARSGRPIEL